MGEQLRPSGNEIRMRQELQSKRLKDFRLVIDPRTKPLIWEDFQTIFSPSAIALDGAVKDRPRIAVGEDASGRFAFANFDHHKGINRYEVPSSSGQVFEAIRSGLFSEEFDKDRKGNLTVFAIDCDPDVILASFLIKYAPFVKQVTGDVKERLHKIMRITNTLDIYGGIAPADPPDSDAMKMQAWLYEPYARFRMSGAINNKDPKQYEAVVAEVEQRIIKELAGEGNRKELATAYEVVAIHELPNQQKLHVVHENGYDARTAMFHNDGVRAFLSFTDLGNGRWKHTIAKMLPKVDLPLKEIFASLNAVEQTQDDLWGGNEHSIGGSPRLHGSKLSPDQVAAIIIQVLQDKSSFRTS